MAQNNHAAVLQGTPEVKRAARLTINLTEAELMLLAEMAREQRIGPCVIARNIVLDFLEGKLVRAEREPTEAGS